MAKKTTSTAAAPKGSKFVQFTGQDGPVFVVPDTVSAVLPQCAGGGALITTTGGNDVRVEESAADVVAALNS